MNNSLFIDSSAETYRQNRKAHWDCIARARAKFHGFGGLYHRRLTQLYRFIVPEGQRVLELGCGAGDLLAALSPGRGVGVDFSSEMLALAGKRYPHLQWLEMDVHDLSGLREKFDFIILSDLIDDLWDVQTVLQEIEHLSTSSTRIIINYYSRLWELPLTIARKSKLATAQLDQNWLTNEDVAN